MFVVLILLKYYIFFQLQIYLIQKLKNVCYRKL